MLVATGRYLGEGFDDARLDTLFLTMPISWRGTLSQYAGRLHRRHASKRDVVIYDYVDENEPLHEDGRQARSGLSKPRVSACPRRRTCSGTVITRAGIAGARAPLIVQNSTPYNGSWPLLMIGVGPVGRSRSDGSGGDAGWSNGPVAG